MTTTDPAYTWSGILGHLSLLGRDLSGRNGLATWSAGGVMVSLGFLDVTVINRSYAQVFAGSTTLIGANIRQGPPIGPLRAAVRIVTATTSPLVGLAVTGSPHPGFGELAPSSAHSHDQHRRPDRHRARPDTEQRVILTDPNRWRRTVRHAGRSNDWQQRHPWRPGSLGSKLANSTRPLERSLAWLIHPATRRRPSRSACQSARLAPVAGNSSHRSPGSRSSPGSLMRLELETHP